MADSNDSMAQLIQLIGPEGVARLRAQMQAAQTFGGGEFGGASIAPAQPISLESLQPFLKLNLPNMQTDRARVLAAELRKRAGTLLDHSAKYGERGGGFLAVGDAVGNIITGQRAKGSEKNLADTEDSLAKARESAGSDSLAVMAAQRKANDDDRAISVEPAQRIPSQGTALTQDVPPSQPQVLQGTAQNAPGVMKLDPNDPTFQKLLQAYMAGGLGG